jgi:hypothetical protein
MAKRANTKIRFNERGTNRSSTKWAYCNAHYADPNDGSGLTLVSLSVGSNPTITLPKGVYVAPSRNGARERALSLLKGLYSSATIIAEAI